MCAVLPNGCLNSIINTSLINDVYNRVMTIENTGPIFRQISDIRAYVKDMEARLTGIETR
jgi:hypothetical protein